MSQRNKLICKLCDEDKKLIKAHIIPEGFFKPLQTDKKAAEIHTNSLNRYPTKSRTGIYDKEILCEKCDRGIGVWDEYAQNILLQNFNEENAINYSNKKVAYKIDNFNYELLKLFFISLLWRASITFRPFFNRISVGPFEKQLKTLIRDKSPGSGHEFSVTLAKFGEPNFVGMLDPHRDRIDGANYCRFYLTGFVAYIKVDNSRFSKTLKQFKITEGKPLFILLRDLKRSKDGALMHEILSKSSRR